MFISGFVAERMDLRYFLSIGMLFSGIFVFLLGFAKVAGIHKIAYFIGMQVLGGAFQAFGWPGVVTVMANWFGKGKKGQTIEYLQPNQISKTTKKLPLVF